jgi:hypothetical protein
MDESLPSHKHYVGTTLEHCYWKEYTYGSYGTTSPRNGGGEQSQCWQCRQLFDSFWEGDDNMDANTLPSPTIQLMIVIYHSEKKMRLISWEKFTVVYREYLPDDLQTKVVFNSQHLQIALCQMLSVWMTAALESKI